MRLPDRQTHGRKDRETPDKVINMYRYAFAGDIKRPPKQKMAIAIFESVGKSVSADMLTMLMMIEKR